MSHVKKSNSDGNVSCRRVFGRCYLSVNDFSLVLLKHSSAIRDYAFAYHDKDVYEDDSDTHKKGDLKVPHIHYCILLQYPIRAKYVGSWFKSETSVNVVALPMVDLIGSFEYLTHKRNPEKYQYPDSVIVCSNFSAFMPEKEFQNSDKLVMALNDMLNGCALRTLVQRYGRDFILNYNKLNDLVGAIRHDDKKDKIKEYLEN